MARAPARSLAPLRRVALHEEIVGAVRDMILEGTLPPGSWVAEIKLCTELGVSRTPLREALKVLASENLVRLVQNRGTVVTEVEVGEVAELFEIMGALEDLVGRLTAERISDADLAALQEMHRQMVADHQAGRRHDYFEQNQAIHLRARPADRQPDAGRVLPELRRAHPPRPLSRQPFRRPLGRIGR